MAAEVIWSLNGVNFGSADPTADDFPVIVAAGVYVLAVQVKGPIFRINYTISGTSPVFTGKAAYQEG